VIVFIQEEAVQPGVPLEIVLISKTYVGAEQEVFYVHKASVLPSDIAEVIKYGLVAGWKPRIPGSETYKIDDGFLDLKEYRLRLPKWWRMLVKKKDGSVLAGSLVMWRPQEGWFTITDDERKNGGKPIRIDLSDVESAIEKDHREHDPGTFGLEDVDVLDRARKHGWKGTAQDESNF
jgi:hypothetical protein